MTDFTTIGEMRGIRRDSPVASTSPDGEAIPIITDSKGRVRTRSESPEKTVLVLGQSIDGAAILVSNVSPTLIHTVSSALNTVEVVHVTFTNLTGSAVQTTVHWGESGGNMSVNVPAFSTHTEIVGALSAGLSISAVAASASAIHAMGYVERYLNG